MAADQKNLEESNVKNNKKYIKWPVTQNQNAASAAVKV